MFLLFNQRESALERPSSLDLPFPFVLISQVCQIMKLNSHKWDDKQLSLVSGIKDRGHLG